MFVNVDSQVELITSHLTIEPMTLLTRIGGIIGVGKEFLWIIISFTTYTAIFHTRITKYFK